MKAVTELVIYKRHLKSCPVDKQRGITPEKARFLFDCTCPFWVHGRTPTGEIVPRHSLGVNVLAEAERKVREHVALIRREHEVIEAHGLLIADAIGLYIESRRDEVAHETVQQIAYALRSAEKFFLARSILYMKELTVDAIERLRAQGFRAGLKSTSRAHLFARVMTFLREAYRRGWIEFPLVEKIRPLKTEHEQKMPFTTDEVKAILQTASLPLFRNTVQTMYAAHPRTFQTLLMLMLETGMRVGDAVRFDPSKLVEGIRSWRYTFRPQKQPRVGRKKELTVFIPRWLRDRIIAMAWLSKELPFSYGPATGIARRRVYKQVYQLMRRLGRVSGVKDCRPHRLRDTFAVNQLVAGTPMDDVSRLLGHSSVTITEIYYAGWVPAREDRLEGIVARTHQEPLYG